MFDPGQLGFDPEPTADSGFLDGIPTAGLVFFGVVVTFIVICFVLVVVSAVKNARYLKRNGIDPMTAQAHFMTALTRSRPGAVAPASLEQRLAELDDLHRRGKINTEELASARASLLSSR